MTSTLDGAIPLPTHAWFPDETLYSICSRHHRLCDHQRVSETCNELAGMTRQDSAHNLPSGVQVLVSRTAGRLGTVDDIIRRRTILSFYLPFLDEPGEADVLRAASHGSVRELRDSLGLAKSIFRANPPLKACEICMGLDLERFGVAYWHLKHQIPGVSYCIDHEVMLGAWHPSRSEGHGYQWILPSRLAVDFGAHRDSTWLRAILLDVSKAAIGVSTLVHRERLDATRLGATYAARLDSRGLVHRKSRLLRRSAIGSEFAQYLANLSGVVDFHPLEPGESAAVSHVVRLLRTPQPLHPLWHVPCIAWLFESWPEFLQAYTESDRY